MPTYPEFNDKTIIITGGSTGIGRATATQFAAEGANVVIADVNATDGDTLVRTITDAGGTAVFVQTDVSDPDAVQHMVKFTVERFGRLDIAFNNAGISGPVGGTHEIALDDWQQVLDINLTGVWLCMKYELPALLHAGGGAIVNTSSVLGMVGTEGFAPYVAAKHGVMGLTKSAAQEYARHNIRVNCINPGWIETAMTSAGLLPKEKLDKLVRRTPVRRWGQAEEVAAAVLWLCSDAASLVTAASLAIDGGLTSM
jgi:NAD(P)-dependent dehydrogenase (short-subunit alcohol dehydrogenase family)